MSRRSVGLLPSPPLEASLGTSALSSPRGEGRCSTSSISPSPVSRDSCQGSTTRLCAFSSSHLRWDAVHRQRAKAQRASAMDCLRINP
jgi:hypothetical protein